MHQTDIRRMFLPVAAAVALLAACSGSESAAEATTVDVVLADSALAMASIETAAFSIVETGAPVFIDDSGLIQFSEASGRFDAPSSADAIVTVKALGLVTEVGAVVIDGKIWITNPITGDWEEAPESFSFDPSVLFAAETGWAAMLSDGLVDPVLLAPTAGDDGRHHVQSTIDADRVSTLTGGLVDEASVVDFWIDPEDDRVVEVAFDVETDEGPTSWLLTLSDFDQEVSITEPDLGG